MGVISIEEARALVADAKIWPLASGFMWNFAPQVHESWIATFAAAIGNAPRNSPRVKAWILEKLGVEPCFHDFPRGDWSRLALLDGGTLLEIAKWLGALAFAEPMRRVMDGAGVRALKAALPGIYPDVLSYTAYFPGLQGKNAAAVALPGGAEIASAGYAMLASLLKPLPQVAARFKFKFPKEVSEAAPEGRGMPGAGPETGKLLKLKFPEAYSLCCS